MDLEIREFTQAIVDYINSSKLPMEVKRLSLRDICAKLETAAETVIREQIAARDKANQAQTAENNAVVSSSVPQAAQECAADSSSATEGGGESE